MDLKVFFVLFGGRHLFFNSASVVSLTFTFCSLRSNSVPCSSFAQKYHHDSKITFNFELGKVKIYFIKNGIWESGSK